MTSPIHAEAFHSADVEAMKWMIWSRWAAKHRGKQYKYPIMIKTFQGCRMFSNVLFSAVYSVKFLEVIVLMLGLHKGLKLEKKPLAKKNRIYNWIEFVIDVLCLKCNAKLRSIIINFLTYNMTSRILYFCLLTTPPDCLYGI